MEHARCSALGISEHTFSEDHMPESWTTEQELKFIKHLGTYGQGDAIPPMRLKLLENDIKASRERTDWGNVNSKKVIAFAEEQRVEEQLNPQHAHVPASVH
jgi:hypothetical protein